MQARVEEKIRAATARLGAKGVEKISVSALCEKAGVSRASFYVYYKDIDDLIAKTRLYIIDKLDQQLCVLIDSGEATAKGNVPLVLDETDLVLLKCFTGKHIFWEFAYEANKMIFPRYEKKMIERYGEKYYNENKKTFELLINGGIGILYFDLLSYDKQTYKKNFVRVAKIAQNLFPGIKI